MAQTRFINNGEQGASKGRVVVNPDDRQKSLFSTYPRQARVTRLRHSEYNNNNNNNNMLNLCSIIKICRLSLKRIFPVTEDRFDIRDCESAGHFSEQGPNRHLFNI